MESLEDDIEVQIADGGERIAAYLINVVVQLLMCLPVIVSLVMPVFHHLDELEGNELAIVEQMMENINMPFFYFGLIIWVVFGIWQIYTMSTRGQSLGKQLMNLAVIKTDGRPAGFVGVVLLREVVFGFGIGIFAALVGLVVSSVVLQELLGSYLPWLICLVMLFTAKDRRTLQDMIANTVVVKLPSKKSQSSRRILRQ